MIYHVNTDGSCNNTSRTKYMGTAFVVTAGSDTIMRCAGAYGPGTSNVAEWTALRDALRFMHGRVANGEPVTGIRVSLDSKLVVNSMKGDWFTTNKNLYPLYRECVQFRNSIIKACIPVRIHWIPRAENAHADLLSKIGRALAEAEVDITKLPTLHTYTSWSAVEDAALEHRIKHRTIE